jgi:hypothetical protein
MAIKTFDSNRVGGGTFQIEQDAATGEFKVKEVGFIKLPELKLPELSSAELPAIPTPEVPTPDVPSVADPFKQPDQRGDDNRDQNINYQNYMRNLQREATGPEQNVMLEDAAGNIQRPVDPITGAGRSQSAKFKERFDPTKIQAAPPRKNILEKAEELFRNSASVNFIGGAFKTGATILENLAGMTDEQRALNNTNRTALKSIGYLTKAELGSSQDPGRIVKFDENGRQLSAADNVFVGMNRESLRGNVFEGAANRVKTRETIGIERIEKKYGKDSQKAKDFRAKTETFKNQIKEAENERDNKQDKSPPKDDNNRGNNQPAKTSQGVTTSQFQAFRN